MAFGVELPDNLGSGAPAEGNAGEATTSPAGNAPSGDKSSNEGTRPETAKGNEPLDLDKLERFRFAGREWKPKDLHNAYLMREDYTRKTQELSEARKYADNFAADLRTVTKEPGRFEEFKRLYPTEYVELAQKYLDAGKLPGPQGTVQPTPSQDPKVAELYDKVAKWEQAQQENEVRQIQSWLDNQFSTLTKKYPFANSELVNARAEVAARQGTKITEEVLDKLFKACDQEIKTKWEEHYKGKVNQQLETGKKARDMGPGGGTPSAAPRTPKTIKEATRMALEDLGAR
jgi:hypothetical protein